MRYLLVVLANAIFMVGCATPTPVKIMQEAAVTAPVAVVPQPVVGGRPTDPLETTSTKTPNFDWGEQNSTKGKGNENSQSLEGPKLDVTPMTRYTDLDSTPSSITFSGAYTRIVIRSEIFQKGGAGSTKGEGEVPTLGYQTRGWLQRYLDGKKYDINLTAKMHVGDYDETVPLATLSHYSDGNGETWIRDLTHGMSNFPWFLVKDGSAASVPRFSVELNGSKTTESGFAGNALGIALTAIKTVAPEAGIVTKLSSGAAKDKAKAIDGALGKLFSNQLTERHVSDRILSKWSPQGGLNIKVQIPKEDGKWNGDLASIGGWTLSFEAPRPSAFSDWQICAKEGQKNTHCKTSFQDAAKEVYKEKNAAAILAYPLIKSLTSETNIKTYLLQQDWYTVASSSFKEKSKENSWIANGLCLAVQNAIHGLGLNSSDANLVVWAAITGIQHPQSVTADTWAKAKVCAAAVQSLQ